MKIRVSPDRQQAHVVLLSSHQACKETTESDLVELLEASRIAIDDFSRQRVEELVKLFQSDKTTTEPFLIAKGTGPTESVDAEFVWDPSLKPEDTPENDKAAVNFYERHRFISVEAGTVIGTITPADRGKEGVDVYGDPIKVKQPPKDIKLGNDLELDEKTRTVRTTTTGQIIVETGKILLRPVTEIPGNVDFGTGNIDAACDVVVRGSVRDLFIVQSKKNITIQGMVDSAYLFAGGEITIIGGVKGRDKGIIEAEGGVNAKFLDSAYLIAGGDLKIAKEAIDNNIICAGTFDIEHGAIIGGRQYAMGGISANVIGSQTNVKTVVGIGCDPRRSRRLIEIRQKIEQANTIAENIRKNVEPLMQHMKRLTSEQREKATELMYKASELEQNIEQAEGEKKQIIDAFPDPTTVELEVSSRIYSGVVIIIANKFVTIKDQIDEPVTIVLRKVEGVTEMQVINKLSGSIRTLLAQPVELEQLEFPSRPEIDQPSAKGQEQSEQKAAVDTAS